MPSATPDGRDPEIFRTWLEGLKGRDPQLHAELSARLETRLTDETQKQVLESVAGASPNVSAQDIAYETIVREGRPALLVRENRIAREGAVFDTASRAVLERLMAAAPTVEPLIPLVGRIDVANYPGTASYLGTGWLVDRNTVVTNRHVAELIARVEGGRYVFRPGRFGEPMQVTLDYRHELGMEAREVAPVLRVVWIEPNARKADFALLEVGRATDGVQRDWIRLAETDAAPNTHVAVIGYPARAPVQVVPDQAWMDRIYGGNYDVKRVAPGLVGAPSQGWATHDCTTLGGNSGSVVVDLDTGRAVALHFAGLYMIENYAVPASVLRRYLKERPWQGSGSAGGPPPPPRILGREDAPEPDRPAPVHVAAPDAAGQVSVTIPLTVTISLGQPILADPAPAAPAGGDAGGAQPPRGGGGGRPGPGRDGGPPDRRKAFEAAARELLGERRGEGVLAVRPGYVLERGRLTDRECLVVSAHPDALESVRANLPRVYAGFPVEVRPASVADQLAAREAIAEAVTSIAYNDDDRTGEGFSLDWVEEEMGLLLHVGPERSWTTLSDFLLRTERELVSSMYEFHAGHVAGALEHELGEGARLHLVLAYQSRDPSSGTIPQGDFDRSETFERWGQAFGDRFERVFVPVGSGGLVARSYHIKVTVRDRAAVWLSSGNWKRTSQPLIPDAKLNDPAATSRAGNREWHVVAESPTLAERFRNHILADYEHSLALGATPEAVGEDEPLVDVPAALLESIQLEAPAKRVLEPLRIAPRVVRVKPLLTPDRQGRVYNAAVLKLIRSARRQLLFQIPYISMDGATAGSLKELVDALVERSGEIEDFRLILRRENDAFWDDVSAFRQRGLDVERCVRRLSHTHTKGMVVDGARVLVGSHNWSSLGVTLNRDASLLFEDEEVAGYYAEAFDLDWRRASELTVEESVSSEAPRLAEGAAPPPGFVRMTLSEFREG